MRLTLVMPSETVSRFNSILEIYTQKLKEAMRSEKESKQRKIQYTSPEEDAASKSLQSMSDIFLEEITMRRLESYL